VTSINSNLTAWIRRARWQRAIAWAVFGLLIGLGLALGLALASRMWPLMTSGTLMVVAVALPVLGIVMAMILPWLLTARRTPNVWAREFDRRFGLNERISTALEIESGALSVKQDELRKRQKLDAEAAVSAVDARAQLPLKSPGRVWLAAGVIMIALGVLLWLPNAQDQVLAAQVRMRETAQEQIQRLEQARQAIENSNLTEAQKRTATEALREAQEALSDPNVTPERALAAINDAQAQLDALRDDTAEQAAQDLREAGQAMSSDALTNSLSDALQRGEFERAAEQMSQLSQRNGQQLNSDEAARTAQQLDQIARQVQNSDAELARNLRQAAQSLREGREEQARRSLQQAAQSLQRANQAQQNNRELTQAQQSAEMARRALAQAQEATASAQGRQQSSNQGDDQINASQLNGQDGSQSQGQGAPGERAEGNVQGNLPGGQGGADAPQGGSTGGGDDVGSESRVYAPGRLANPGQGVTLPEGQGINSPNPGGPSSVAPDGDTSVPYQDVYGDYAGAADEALRSGEVPADRRDYVREYFSSLDPRQDTP
jgi:septal ring factor EnvC (AmiA/AmiB activator)